IAVPKARSERGSLALEVVKNVVDLKDKEILELTFPMKKEREDLVESWEEAERQVLIHLCEGKDVAFISIGDPLFHSTFIYLMEAIKDGDRARGSPVSIVVIPGVSSIHASTASAKLSLAKSNERVAILPATYETDKLKETLKGFDTVVLMKVHRVMDKVVAILEELGLKDKAVFVSKAGWPEEMVVRDLEGLKDKKLDYFSMVIIKKRGG
ncbi:MAG: precorrin-2 C(20)-methyltransferase, partial [Deltaproteobacteria bacterium]|nr:precorrin-2 C(20)-methyltransferase [Deltaproteobacteria bacterium]